MVRRASFRLDLLFRPPHALAADDLDKAQAAFDHDQADLAEIADLGQGFFDLAKHGRGEGEGSSPVDGWRNAVESAKVGGMQRSTSILAGARWGRERPGQRLPGAPAVAGQPGNRWAWKTTPGCLPLAGSLHNVVKKSGPGACRSTVASHLGRFWYPSGYGSW